MALERRGRSAAYYQKVREDGRIRSIYKGSDEEARTHANAKAIEKREAQALDTLSASLQQFCDHVDSLVETAMLANGYHLHARGEWRKKRKGSTNGPKGPPLPE